MNSSKKVHPRPSPESLTTHKHTERSHESPVGGCVSSARVVGDSSESNPGGKLVSSQPSGALRVSPGDVKLLTLKEAADRLAISLPTIRSWVWQRKIEIVKIGRCVRVREQVISELISKSTIPPRTKL